MDNFPGWLVLLMGVVINFTAAAVAVHIFVSGVKTEIALLKKDVDRHDKKVEDHDKNLTRLEVSIQRNTDLTQAMSDKLAKVADDASVIRKYEREIINGIAGLKEMVRPKGDRS